MKKKVSFFFKLAHLIYYSVHSIDGTFSMLMPHLTHHLGHAWHARIQHREGP